MKNYKRSEIQEIMNTIANEFKGKIKVIKLTKSQKKYLEMMRNGQHISNYRQKTFQQLIDLGLVSTNSLGKTKII